MMTRLLSVAAALLCGFVTAQDHKPAPDTKPAVKTEAKVEHKAALYPIDTCIASGEKLGDDAVVFQVDGTTFKTCCEKCKAKVEAGAAPFKAKLEEASKAAQLANYPLKTCAISGEPLGSMGAPVQLMLEGTLVQLCCKSCTKKAMAKPAEMAKKVTDAAYEAQKAQVNETCPVGGEAIADDKVDVMFGTRLVRFCCAKCVAKFEQEPAKYLPNLVQHAPGKEQEADEKKADKPKDGEHKGHG